MTHSVIKLVLCHLLGLIIIKGKQLQEAFNNDIHSVAKPAASITLKVVLRTLLYCWSQTLNSRILLNSKTGLTEFSNTDVYRAKCTPGEAEII